MEETSWGGEDDAGMSMLEKTTFVCLTLWIQGSAALNARKFRYNLGAICIFLGGTWIHRVVR